MAPTGSQDRDKSIDQKKNTQRNVATHQTVLKPEDVATASPDAKVDGQVEAKQTDEKDAKLLQKCFLLNQWFQHYHSRKCVVHCETCSKVQSILDHNKQDVERIGKFHKDICQIRKTGVCAFCSAIDRIGGEENTDPCTAQADPVDEIITDEITPIKATSVKGMKFVDGKDYKLDGSLGKGGNGEVFAVKLLPSGKEKLGMEADNLLAVKIANVEDEEKSVLKRLDHCPHIEIHYFIVRKPQKIYWWNRKTRNKELKDFPDLLFMKRAEKSLSTHKSNFPDRVLGLDEACYYFWQLLKPISYAHTLVPPIVHNDLKSSNVLLMNDSAFLADFEYATTTGKRRGGTPFFMALKKRGEPVDPADDIFSFGVMFLEVTIPRAIPTNFDYKDTSAWSIYKAAKVQELKSKHMGLGLLIEACLQRDSKKRPTADYLFKRIDKIGAEERWWPTTPGETPALE